MSIRTADTIVALCINLSDEDIAALPPAERRRLADHTRNVADKADRGGRKAPIERTNRKPELLSVRKGSSAEEGICPSCGEATEPDRPTCGDTQCKTEHGRYVEATLKTTPQPNGVLSRLRRGERSP